MVVFETQEDPKQRSKEYHKKRDKIETDEYNKRVRKAVEHLLWKQLLEGGLSKNSEKQKAIVQQSPIMQAFMRASAKKPKEGA